MSQSHEFLTATHPPVWWSKVAEKSPMKYWIPFIDYIIDYIDYEKISHLGLHL